MKKIEEFEYLIGKDFDKSKSKLENPYILHPSTIDGRPIFKTYDFNFYRINVEVDNGKITKLVNIG